MDYASRQILLANIVELRGLFSELNDPRNGNNQVSAKAIQVEIIARVRRLENGQFYSPPSN